MDLQHRKLLSDSMSQICDPYCDPSNDSGVCLSSCLSYCPDICHYLFFPILPPPSPPSPPISLIIGLVFLAISFLSICCYAIYSKFNLTSRRRSQPQPQTNEFLYEDQDPDVDHHIPNINTTGLQPTIINAISVCKYKRCDDRVEGTDCSVCLNEFQEDETLKLLPKCSHAFHIPCIDTWLRSHNNCPLCRAPIVKHTARASSSEANVDNSGVGEESRLNISEDNEEAEREMDSGIHELRIEAQEECELAVENERKRGEDSNEQGGFNTAN